MSAHFQCNIWIIKQQKITLKKVIKAIPQNIKIQNSIQIQTTLNKHDKLSKIFSLEKQKHELPRNLKNSKKLNIDTTFTTTTIQQEMTIMLNLRKNSLLIQNNNSRTR